MSFDEFSPAVIVIKKKKKHEEFITHVSANSVYFQLGFLQNKMYGANPFNTALGKITSSCNPSLTEKSKSYILHNKTCKNQPRHLTNTLKLVLVWEDVI